MMMTGGDLNTECFKELSILADQEIYYVPLRKKGTTLLHYIFDELNPQNSTKLDFSVNYEYCR